jgi:hypothetical protein
MRSHPLAALTIACGLLAACGSSGGVDDTIDTSPLEPPAPFAFYTPAWEDGDDVPSDYTCDGADGWLSQNNPELVWEAPPEGTKAFAMIFDDPDAGEWEHWAFFVNDADVLGVPEGTSDTADLPPGIVELNSGDGRTGYVPNCPSGATHAYRWRLWALDTEISLDGTASFTELEEAAKDKKIEKIEFTGMSDAGR